MIDIVFENSHFVFCDKPAGVLSTPSRFEGEDTRACLGTSLQKQLGQQIFPVHRLDFEVSGLVMYAKNAEAHRKANGWFENKTVFKSYKALTTGQSYTHIPAQVVNPKIVIELKEGDTFEWTSRLLRGKRRAYESPQGKPSVTKAVYEGLFQDYKAWELHPITGRSHQLRFDLSRHGFPIVGDELYGSSVKLDSERIALRSYKIDFSKAPKFASFGLPETVQISCDFKSLI